MKKGLRRVFITLGERGVFYKDELTKKFVKPPAVKVVNATGAGDAFMAGLVYSYINDLNLDDTIQFSMYASEMALSHENTINPNISVDSIYNKMRSE